MQDIVTMPVRGLAIRVVTLVVVVFAVGLVYLGGKWQLGDMLARLTRPADPNATIAADAALGLAPSDPFASALRAEIGKDPDSEETRSAAEIAQETVRLSPLDHRWHLALARAYADEGRTEKADAEFKRAIELAPSYSVCGWYYGNFLLRQGRRDDAVAQFRVAAAADPDYRRQVLSLMWDYSAHNPAALEAVAGNGVDNIAELTFFLAEHGHGSDAIRNWDRLTEDEKSMRREIAGTIAQGLVDQHLFASALEFSRQMGADPNARSETVTNGSFESSIETGEDSHFAWRISRNDPKLEIALDDHVKHDGGRSLRMTFRSTARPTLFNAVQTVAVMPNAKYRLTFWLRTENLKSPNGPLIDISTGDESKSLARTPAFPNGTNDWRQITLDISVPADADGIEIRTLRQPCNGDDCPISGIVWYDEFVLTRL